MEYELVFKLATMVPSRTTLVAKPSGADFELNVMMLRRWPTAIKLRITCQISAVWH